LRSGVGFMNEFSRRAFVGASAVGAAALWLPRVARAQAPRCEPSGAQAFLPSHLTVDCASRQNFRTFRTYSKYLGLTGVVSMAVVAGQFGTYSAGNLLLFPWLKPAGQKLAAQQREKFSVVVPVGATVYISSSPIPDATLPLDAYFCSCVLQVPWTSFIGFEVDVPYSSLLPSEVWFTNVGRLADGDGVGINWTSSNLNASWFNGSTWILPTTVCNGTAWRKLIIAALDQASAGAC
jgi:hypothetical protein